MYINGKEMHLHTYEIFIYFLKLFLNFNVFS